MRPVVGVGRAFVVFQQQRQVEIAGVESFGNKIPVLNHGFHKPLYILLRSEALCVGHLTTVPYLRQKFAWWDCARPADQVRDESVQLFQIHGAFVVPLASSPSRNWMPCGRSTRTRCSAPVTGFRIGSAVMSRMPGTWSRPRRRSTSTSIAIGRNSGSSLFGAIAEYTHKIVAISSVSAPVMILYNASRCTGSARSSVITCIVPLPAWIALN